MPLATLQEYLFNEFIVINAVYCLYTVRNYAFSHKVCWFVVLVWHRGLARPYQKRVMWRVLTGNNES